MGLAPLFLGNLLLQVMLSLQGIFSSGKTQPMGDTENMSINGNGRFSKGHTQHDIGSLASYTGKTQEGLHLLRNLGMEVINKFSARSKDIACFGMIKAAVMDEGFHLFKGQGAQLLRRIVLWKKALCNNIDPFIRALSRKDDRHQEFKRGGIMQGRSLSFIGFFKTLSGS